MGTDIHLYVEIKKNGKWEKVKKGLRSERYNPNNDYFSKEKFRNGERIYNTRNYVLFAFLANVRNGKGFAGRDTGNIIVPISFPKGIPLNVSEDIIQDIDSWGLNAHSISYLDLSELKKGCEDSKNMTLVKRGAVDIKGFKEFKRDGCPKEWWSDIIGSKIVFISNNEMQKLIDNPTLKKENLYYFTRIEWRSCLYDSVNRFFEHVLPQLENLKHTNNLTDKEIRIVFWFDN
ncbi:MAG: hypothetical protein ACTSQY_00885 [Candidatus Odinarchaeia archaeon]